MRGEVVIQWKERFSRNNNHKDLPEDLVAEIAARLPVKSLIRFKCVCKLWYALITSHEFIAKHNTINKSKKVSLFFHSGVCDNPDEDGPVSTLSFCFSDVPKNLRIPRPCDVRKVRIVGCCDGVVCLSLGNEFALWNPGTGLFRTIGQRCTTSAGPSAGPLFGFCFDPVAKSFKVVCVRYQPRYNKNAQLVVKVDSLTVRTNSWREKVLTLPYRVVIDMFYNPIVCKGRYMYWNTEYDYISSFDMVDETFKRIELPSSCKSSWYRRLALYKDTIALFVRKVATIGNDGHRYYFDVLVMNDCLGRGGTTESCWTHQLTVAPTSKEVNYARGFFIKDDVYLPVVVTDLVELFDPETDETTRFPRQEYLIELFQYHQTLVSF